MRRAFCRRRHGEGEPCRCRPERLSRLIEPVALLVLKQQPGTHGYEIVRRIREFAMAGGSLEPGAVYRVLRHLERMGALRSEWVLAEAGAARRGYVLTEEGEGLLEDWAEVIREWCHEMEQFIQVYDTTKEETR
ncbi:MAG: PadR family transcriptional regulator [Armatimonadota bacterium]